MLAQWQQAKVSVGIKVATQMTHKEIAKEAILNYWLKRAGLSDILAGPVESLAYEIRGDLVKLWDDKESIILPYGAVTTALQETDSSDPQEFWSHDLVQGAMAESWEEVNEDHG